VTHAVRLPSPVTDPDHLSLQLDTVAARLAARRATLIEEDDYSAASVALILRSTDEGLQALFIRRAEHPEDRWSGHMALPGGRRDPEDSGPQAVAERETLEEVGVDLTADAQLLGRLDDLQAMAHGRWVGMAVSPFVYHLDHDVELSPNHEVEATVWVTLDRVHRGEYDAEIPWTYGPEGAMLPCFQVGPYTIWGLTWRMLVNFLSVAGDHD
jgi:8-oxo-dGTP pyrophosphatase MutT (NUDIX family)